MRSNALFVAAGSLMTVLLVGCNLSSADNLAQPAPPTSDTHLTILQTTDIHDHADGDGAMSASGPAPLGSYARIAAYVNAVRANASADSPVVLVDSGDFTMGTLYDLTISQQPAATYFIDTLRYDCVTFGNHEFDYTPKGLATLLAASQSKFGFQTPIVASNLNLNGNADLAPYVGSAILPSYTKTLSNGLKVGFIGLMGKDAAADAPNSAPVSFTDYSQNYTLIQTMVTQLRKAQGCNVVIALDHAGTDVSTGGYTGEDVKLAQNVTGIDVIASGHTHNAFGADGKASHPVTNGTWTTQVICAGAFGTNVERIDLTYHVTNQNTTLVSASNLAMTDATLSQVPNCLVQDPAAAVFVGQTDASLNAGLGSLFGKFFPDYSAANLNTGVYHPVGVAAQAMSGNDTSQVISPCGLGNLCADSLRNVPNGLINMALVGAGWNPAAPNTLAPAITALVGAGYDPTPFTLGVVPSGVIRDGLPGGTAITFSDLYSVLPLGISPDATQAIPVGYPLLSAYVTYADLQKLCAMQLLSQCNLTNSDDYLNLSGVSYALDPAGTATFFQYATAASVLEVVNAKAAGGSTLAQKALQDLASLGPDQGASLMKDMATNPYAAAMVNLNNPALIPANLGALGAVASCAAADAANNGISLSTLIVSKAVAAIGQVSAFASTDATCKGPVTALSSSGRYRVAGDLYSIAMMGAVQSQFGIAITAYADSQSSKTLTVANMPGLMANRINLNGPVAAVQELKGWMALTLYLITPPAQGGYFTNGTITAEYASSPTFTNFGQAGAAVQVRNASYPLPSIGQLMATLQSLEADS